MGRTSGCFSALLVVAVGASAQCYQFTSTGATLQVNISSFFVQDGPILINGNYESLYSFVSTNTLIMGGSTQTTQSLRLRLTNWAKLRYWAGLLPQPSSR